MYVGTGRGKSGVWWCPGNQRSLFSGMLNDKKHEFRYQKPAPRRRGGGRGRSSRGRRCWSPYKADY